MNSIKPVKVPELAHLVQSAKRVLRRWYLKSKWTFFLQARMFKFEARMLASKLRYKLIDWLKGL